MFPGFFDDLKLRSALAELNYLFENRRTLPKNDRVNLKRFCVFPLFYLVSGDSKRSEKKEQHGSG